MVKKSSGSHNFVCDWEDPVSGESCLKQFNERGNLQVSYFYPTLTIFHRSMFASTPVKSHTSATLAQPGSRPSGTEMTTREGILVTNPIIVPCLGAPLATTVSISWLTMEIPVNIALFQKLTSESFWQSPNLKKSVTRN